MSSINKCITNKKHFRFQWTNQSTLGWTYYTKLFKKNPYEFKKTIIQISDYRDPSI